MVGHILDEQSTIGMNCHGVTDAGHDTGVGALRVAAGKASFWVVSECWADFLRTEVERVAEGFVDTLDC